MTTTIDHANLAPSLALQRWEDAEFGVCSTPLVRVYPAARIPHRIGPGRFLCECVRHGFAQVARTALSAAPMADDPALFCPSCRVAQEAVTRALLARPRHRRVWANFADATGAVHRVPVLVDPSNNRDALAELERSLRLQGRPSVAGTVRWED